MRPLKNIALLTIGGLMSTGCMTLTRGTNVEMQIDTTPSGALVLTDLETPQSRRARKKQSDLEPVFFGCSSTPCRFEVPRRASLNLLIEKDGYHPALICAESGLSGLGTVGAGATTAAGVSTGLAIGSSVAGASSLSGGILTAAAGGAVIAVGLGSAIVDTASGAILSVYPNKVSLVMFDNDQTLPELTVTGDDRQATTSLTPPLQVITARGGIVAPPETTSPIEIKQPLKEKILECVADTSFKDKFPDKAPMQAEAQSETTGS